MKAKEEKGHDAKDMKKAIEEEKKKEEHKENLEKLQMALERYDTLYGETYSKFLSKMVEGFSQTTIGKDVHQLSKDVHRIADSVEFLRNTIQRLGVASLKKELWKTPKTVKDQLKRGIE